MEIWTKERINGLGDWFKIDLIVWKLINILIIITKESSLK